MEPYAPEIEAAMNHFYTRSLSERAIRSARFSALKRALRAYQPALRQPASLDEKDRRRYAGIEALKLGQGGRNYIARVLHCSRHTVTKDAKEVSGGLG